MLALVVVWHRDCTRGEMDVAGVFWCRAETGVTRVFWRRAESDVTRVWCWAGSVTQVFWCRAETGVTRVFWHQAETGVTRVSGAKQKQVWLGFPSAVQKPVWLRFSGAVQKHLWLVCLSLSFFLCQAETWWVFWGLAGCAHVCCGLYLPLPVSGTIVCLQHVDSSLGRDFLSFHVSAFDPHLKGRALYQSQGASCRLRLEKLWPVDWWFCHVQLFQCEFAFLTCLKPLCVELWVIRHSSEFSVTHFCL